MDASRLSAALLHTFSVVVMAWGYRSMTGSAFDAWIQTQKGGQSQFLTIQGLALAWTTALISLTLDAFPGSLLLRKLKRTLSMIAMPLEFLISLIYWSLLLLMPNLIVPVSLEPGAASSSSAAPEPFRLDLSIDLALHAVPAVVLLADFVLFEQRYTRRETTLNAPVLTGAMAVWYASWVEYCASNNGSFPYPFLTYSPLAVRLMIYGGSSVLAVGMLWVVNALHSHPILGQLESVDPKSVRHQGGLNRRGPGDTAKATL
ncbi:hypothetical protein BV25DRAFT_1821916 [Artomyces pyxidatus]|uniref:Uncharacterized protein n=1 Tax=Artomyces pyxidatus TaxID=48021 RepID=A0ACB8TAC1_9AGAM|nr:hypothetical protein BV25DRAFT_1821916 [Artomyces pyxidatus]